MGSADGTGGMGGGGVVDANCPEGAGLQLLVIRLAG